MDQLINKQLQAANQEHRQISKTQLVQRDQGDSIEQLPDIDSRDLITMRNSSTDKNTTPLVKDGAKSSKFVSINIGAEARANLIQNRRQKLDPDSKR